MKVVHYINQFFAGIGGEEKADHKPEIRRGPVGPGMALEVALKEHIADAQIVATVICGDSYFNENLEPVKKEILQMVKGESPDLFISGPAFNAGRYGTAAATIGAFIQKELGIPGVTAMYEENPGVDMFRKEICIGKTSNSAAGMRKAIPTLAKLGADVYKGEEPEEGTYFEKGIRKNIFHEERGSKRAVEMLVKKLKGEEFVTEYPMPIFDSVEPGKAIKDLSKARLALVTSGGIVPSGNPDRIEASSASKYGEYDLDDAKETAHGGYDPVYANEDTNRVTPVDVLKDLVQEGIIGSLHPKYYTTTGNGTAVASAKAYASEIAKKLVADKVEGVILTST